jgi:hypothetical protein
VAGLELERGVRHVDASIITVFNAQPLGIPEAE